MAIAYRETDPVSSRWTGLGRLLTAFEVDYNFYQHETRLGTLEAAVTTTVSIGTITQPTSTTLLITMTDATTRGPFTLPVSTFLDRGTWAPSTAYAVNDTFTANGGLYRVIFAHTSDLTFSPTANNGAGQDYYKAMLSSPGNVLPTGGATGMMLKKSSGTDYAVTWAYPLPGSGTQFQVLMKNSSTTQDASWATLGASHVSFSPSTASGLTSTNVASALEELKADILGAGGALSTLSDVNVTEGSGINGYFLQWNNGTTKWVASTVALSVLSDVNVTEGSGINGYFLKWDNATTKWVAATSALSGLSDVNVTEGSGINGYFLQWNNATSKWVAAAGSNNLSGLADVNVTEGSGINGYFLQWDNATSKWVAAASSSSLSGLSDVNVTEGSGIDGYFLKWNNGTTKWVASTSSLSGLADVNVTEGSGINGYFLKWDNATSKWVASLSGATATALSGLTDVNVTEGAGIDGYLLKWNNGTSKWIALTPTTFLQASNNLSDLASAATARSNLGVSAGSIEVVIDGGGSVITTGLKGYVRAPFGGTITEATLLGDQSGSIVVNVWKCTYTQFDAGSTHPVAGDKITASAPPTISSATKADDNTLTGWTTAFSAGDIFAFNVDSVTTLKRVTLALKYTK